MKTYRVRCPLCWREGTKPYLTCIDRLVSGESFCLWHCQECDVVWTTNAPDPEKISRYYSSSAYLPHLERERDFLSRLYALVRRGMLERKARWIEKRLHKRKKSPRSILDIGCGTGQFLDYMRKKGWKVKGVEPDPRARDYAARHFGLTLIPPKKLKDLKPGSFDVITLWHALEHVHDVHRLLSQCHNLLKPSGLLVIALPNRTSWEASHYGSVWAAYDVPRHLWHFSPQALGRLLSRHGFRIIEKKPLPFDPFYIALLSEIHRGRVFPWLTGLWTGFVSWFRGWKDPARASALVFVIRPQ